MYALPATPGVHLQRTDPGASDLTILRTDIVGFAGFAERGPVGPAVAVETMGQFASVFGGYWPGAELAYAVRAFFENGGRRCRVVRVASEAPLTGVAPASLEVTDDLGNPAFTLVASSPGAWGKQLDVSVRVVTAAETLIPAQADPARSPATSVALFQRGDLVRLSQPGRPAMHRLLADVDRPSSTLVWLLPQAARRQPWERPVTGFDLARPLRAERLVYEIVVRERGRVLAIYAELGLHPVSRRYVGDVLRPVDFEAVDLSASRVIPPIMVEIPERPATFVPEPAHADFASWHALSGGRDGLASVTEADIAGRPVEDRALLRGFESLARARDLSILAAPDLVGRRVPPVLYGAPEPVDPCLPCFVPSGSAPRPRPQPREMAPRFDRDAIQRLQTALADLCEREADRIAILDPPWETAETSRLGLAPITDWRRRFETSYAALAFPWCLVPDPAAHGATRPVPPSGHVAGRMAADDLARSIPWTGANVPLDWITDTSLQIGFEAHGRLNEVHVNAITVTHGRAPRLMGARLLSSASAWRFLTTRRVVCAIRRQLTAALQWAVFAPNDTITRLMILRQTGEYLEMLRRRGALAGGTPEEAWFARCDDTTTTGADRENGRLVIEIGVAVAAPLEFILLRLGRSADRLEIAGQGEGLLPLLSEAAP